LRVYVNSLLYHYIGQAHAIQRQLLAIRLSDPSRFADIQRLEVERIVDDVPLCIANANQWMGTIWELLLKDFPQPETHEILRRLGYHRRERSITKKSRAANIRDGIKHALSRYFVRMLRAEEPTDK
jgi:hypothetical protein